MSVNGVRSAHVIVGAYNQDSFEIAVEKFIEPIVGSLANGDPCSVVVLDNCTIHNSPQFFQMVRAKGGIVIFLP